MTPENPDPWDPPCPKCGDDTGSRRVRYVVLDPPELPGEALELECIACGYAIGLFHPMDHEKAGEKIDG